MTKPFDPFTATEAEARELQPSTGRDDVAVDTSGPFFQFAHAQTINRMRKRLSEPGVILDALAECLTKNLSVPAWLSQAFLVQYRKARNYRVRSWDEAFGPLIPKGAHRSKMRFKHQLELLVFDDVCTKINEGKPIDAGLFEEVGSRYAIGKTLTEELYRKYLADIAQQFPFEPVARRPVKSRKLAGIHKRK